MRKTVLYLSAASLFLSSYTLKNDKEYSLAEEHIKNLPEAPEGYKWVVNEDYTDEFNAVTTALDITNMTHVNTQSDNACRIYAQLIFRILNNNITKDDMDKMIDNTMYYDYKNEETQPTASAYDSIIAMLHAFMPTDNFEDAVLTAINWGGDSDTIGAITGGLAGCYYGYDNIPTRFIEAIPSDIKKMLDTIIEAIPN